MKITILDEGDNCTYDLDLSLDDALAIYNMRTLHKSNINLLSIGGNACITGNNVTIMYKNGSTGHGTIGIPLSGIQLLIDNAMQK